MQGWRREAPCWRSVVLFTAVGQYLQRYRVHRDSKSRRNLAASTFRIAWGNVALFGGGDQGADQTRPRRTIGI